MSCIRIQGCEYFCKPPDICSLYPPAFLLHLSFLSLSFVKGYLFNSLCVVCVLFWCVSLFFLFLSFHFLLSLSFFFFFLNLSIDSDQTGACPYSAARAESAFGKVQSREASERIRGKDGKHVARRVDVAPACSRLYPLPFFFSCFSVMHQPRLSFRSHRARQGLHH